MGTNLEYASFYRRFRPQRFSEVLGQEHVTRALRNALINNKVGHAYLFSGPRGTGKTSTARILAKALNCRDRKEGEPCCECESCQSVTQGRSMDVIELDAASNSGVDAMKALISLAPVGTAGDWKVYILDEVHMLTTAASNALLKTLEEPPPHVIFVLATTDPQKVLPTILSRTQSFEFRLMDDTILEQLVKSVRESATLNIGDNEIEYVIKKGNGSARDTLSFLDQVVALGNIDDSERGIQQIFTAIANQDPNQVLIASNMAFVKGVESARIISEIVGMARQQFLQSFDSKKSKLTMPTAKLVKIVEVLGGITTQLRDSPDPRATLEAALIRLCMDPSGIPNEIESFINTAISKQINLLKSSNVFGSVAAQKISSPEPQETNYESSGAIPTRAKSAPPKDFTRQQIANARNQLATPDSSSGIENTATSRLQGLASASHTRLTSQNQAPSPEATNRTDNVDDSKAITQTQQSSARLTRDTLTQVWPQIVSDCRLGNFATTSLTSGYFRDATDTLATYVVDNTIQKQNCQRHLEVVQESIRSRYQLNNFTIQIVIEPKQGDLKENSDKVLSSAEFIDEFKDGEVLTSTSLSKRIREVFPNSAELTQ